MLLAQRFCWLQRPVRRITAAATFRSLPRRVHRRVARRIEKEARRAAAQAVCSTAPVSAPAAFKLGRGMRPFAPPAGQGSATSARSIVVKIFSGSSSSRCSRTPEGLGFGHVLSAVGSAAGLVPALSTCFLVATRHSSSSRVPAAFRHGRLLCVVASASTGSGDSMKGMSPWEFRILDEEKGMQAEVLMFWQEVLDKLTRPEALMRLAMVDFLWATGMSPMFPQAGLSKQPNCFEVMQWSKRHYPYAVALVKVGNFYETCGIDSLVLVEYCGYQFMGGGLQAGAPISSLDMVLSRLVKDAGLDVAIFEEVGDVGNSKARALVQVVTPENPQYMYNFADRTGDVDVEAPAVCGIARTSRGYTVYLYCSATSSIMMREGLTLDGVWGYINADRSSKPVVYFIKHLDMIKSKDAALVKKRLDPDTVIWREFSALEPLEGFTNQLLKHKQLPADTVLQVNRFDAAIIIGTRALYYSTASQLGLAARALGVPNLLDFLLPETARKVVRDTLFSLLTCPPPYAVAAAVREVTRMLVLYDKPLPPFSDRGVTPRKAELVLDAQEANAGFFQGLAADLLPVLEVLRPFRTPQEAALVSGVWPLLMHVTYNMPGQLTEDQVLAAAERAVVMIYGLIADLRTTRRSSSNSSSLDAGEGSADEEPVQAAGRRVLRSKSRAKSKVTVDLSGQAASAAAAAAIEAFGDIVELWRRKVLPSAIQAEVDVFRYAGEHLVGVAAALLFKAYREAQKAGVTAGKDCPALVLVDTNSNSPTVRLQIPTEAVRKALVGVRLQGLGYMELVDGPDGQQEQPVELPDQVLRPASDRRGKGTKTDLFSCSALDLALAEFLDANAAANQAANAVLKRLSVDLAVDKNALVAALQLGILLTTLWEHTRQAVAAGWTVPLVGSSEQLQVATGSSSGSSLGGHPEHDGVFDLRGLWPYWMSGSDPLTVRNDVGLDGFMLLTGPNMAGKSTVLRSVAAAALAGSVGLAIPAAAGSRLPLLDAVILRTFSGDAPQEGLSAYGVEMKEMGTVLSDARPSSLVLVDELGKGTEVVSGTALAAGILRDLAAKGSMGVFATHLHLLVNLLGRVPNIQQYMMEVVTRAPRSTAAAAGGAEGELYSLQPTWKLKPGTCFKSLAFAVARDCGLPPSVLAAAESDYHTIVQGGSSMSAAYESIVEIARGTTGAGMDTGSSSSGDAAVGSVDSDASNASSDEARQQQQQQVMVWQTAEVGEGEDCECDSSEGGESEGTEGEVEEERYELPAPILSRRSSSSSKGLDKVKLDDARASVQQLFEQMRPSLLSAAPAEDVSAAAETAAETAAAAAAEGPDSAAVGRRRRRLKQTDQDLQQDVQGQASQQSAQPAAALTAGAAAGGAPGNGGPQYAVVHELLPGMQPPPAHEGESVLYVLVDENSWWYGGETQEVRKRLQRHRQKFGKQLVMWYVLAAPEVNRKVVQGHMIRAAEQMGLRLSSNKDAAMARRK